MSYQQYTVYESLYKLLYFIVVHEALHLQQTTLPL